MIPRATETIGGMTGREEGNWGGRADFQGCEGFEMQKRPKNRGLESKEGFTWALRPLMMGGGTKTKTFFGSFVLLGETD